MHMPTASRLTGLGVDPNTLVITTDPSQDLINQVNSGGGVIPSGTKDYTTPTMMPVTPIVPASCGMGPYAAGSPCDQAATTAAASYASTQLAQCGMGPYTAGSACDTAATQARLLDSSQTAASMGMTPDEFKAAQDSARAALLADFSNNPSSNTTPILLALGAILLFKAIQ
jgi:hypothetical protein